METWLCPICKKSQIELGGSYCRECEVERIGSLDENDYKSCPPKKVMKATISFEGDTVNHPSHYNTGKIEVIEFIEDQKLDYHLGNAVKYICRAGKKDAAKFGEDLEKAIWYVRRAVEIKSENPRRPNEMTK